MRLFDRDQAARVKDAGCSCGGTLHRASYLRKPRGGPAGFESDRQYCRRESFCCNQEGCRRRATPPALRFLDRKVFFSVWVLVLSALRNGPTPRRLRELSEHYAVSERTIRRWQRFWRERLPQQPIWVALRGRLASPILEEELPGSLLAAFDQISDIAERVVAVLRCLLCPDAVSLLGERPW
jgi:hypothetical protein